MSLLGLPCITLALASLLTLALGKGIVARVFSTAWLRWLGGISYGVYVYHVLLRNVFDWIVATLAPHASRNLALGLRFIVAAALTRRYFDVAGDAEIAVELDPRTTSEAFFKPD